MLSTEEKKMVELTRKAGEKYRDNKKNGKVLTFNEKVLELGYDFEILRLGY